MPPVHFDMLRAAAGEARAAAPELALLFAFVRDACVHAASASFGELRPDQFADAPATELMRVRVSGGCRGVTAINDTGDADGGDDDSARCLGGVQLLLPLLARLPRSVVCGPPPSTLLVQLIGLIAQTLCDSPADQVDRLIVA